MDSNQPEVAESKPKSKISPISILVILAVLVVVGSFTYLLIQNTTKLTSTSVIATIDGQDIVKQQIDDVTLNSKQTPKEVLDKLIKTQILEAYLKKAGFTVSEDEIAQNLKTGQRTDPSNNLDSKLDLVNRKLKAYYQLNDQSLDSKYQELKGAAKITIHVQL